MTSSDDLPTSVQMERRRLFELLMQAPAIICVLRGPQHEFELTNPAYLALVKRDAASLIGRPVHEAIPEVRQQGYIDLLDQVYTSGEPFVGRELKLVVEPPDGGPPATLYHDVVYQPTRDRAGQVDGILVHAVDVTAQVTARKEVEELAARLEAERDRSQQERRLYHTILSHTPDFAYVLGLDHRFIYANDALLRMWGRSRDEAIGRGWLELGYEPWHAAMHDREIDEVIATRQPVRGEVPFEGTNGRRIYDYIFVPVLGESGQVEAIAGTTRDVTEQVKARETVAERRRELEQLVGERTSKLEQAVQQMEEFSYSVSHDLRAPTRAIRGFAEALLQDHGAQLDSNGRELLMRIERSGARMDRLIQDLLTYSRIAGRDVPFERVRLDYLIRDVITQYPDMQPARATIEIAPPLPDVLAHEPSLSQVISNLLGNAVKFVPPQTRPHVRIRAERVANNVRVWFEDNGIGIAPKHQSRLFGLFERIHPQTTYEGTGVGLAIVRKAMERMNGRVGLESDGVSGSRFWIELPRAE